MNGFGGSDGPYSDDQERRAEDGRSAVTAMAIEPDPNWAYLLETWRELDVPDGWRAEIEGGQIVLVPPPNKGDNLIAGVVHRALLSCLPAEVGIYQTLGTGIAPLEKLYIPDLVVAEEAALTSAEEDPLDATEAMMVVEITSRSTARQDRTKKLWGYAHAPVPLYLLIDRFDEHGPTVTLFSDPLGGVYQRSVRTPFGKPVSLPEPFGVELGTERFPGAAGQ